MQKVKLKANLGGYFKKDMTLIKQGKLFFNEKDLEEKETNVFIPYLSEDYILSNKTKFDIIN